MTAEQISRLGEPYYSIKDDKGTGIGLMVSYSIIRAMKGSVNVSSKIGTGTSFSISLPQYLPWSNQMSKGQRSIDTILNHNKDFNF